MLYSGLRIMDTAMLTADSVKGDRIQFRQAKTGEPVSVIVPHEVAEALRSLPRRPHFFWAGKATPTNAAASWGVRLSAVFKRAGIHNGHSHRLRDTFAVRLLTAGVSLENVSALLGHTSIRTTEEFYSPWIKVRQDALDREVSRAMQDYPEEQFRNNSELASTKGLFLLAILRFKGFPRNLIARPSAGLVAGNHFAGPEKRRNGPLRRKRRFLRHILQILFCESY